MLIMVDAGVWGAMTLFEPLGEVQTFDGRTVTPAQITAADALIVRTVTRVDAALLAGSRVRFVATASSGTDHVDTAWLASHGIHFAFAPGCNARPVAEYVLAAIFLMARRLGFDPRGRTLGVVGVGRIGSVVVQWAKALGMAVLMCDPPLSRRGCAGPFVDISELAGRSDIVTLHVPLTRHGPDPTWNMVSAAWLSALKPGAILINTARGEVVHESDLLAAVDAGVLGGVVLDVWRDEPLINRRLAARVDIATPHIAGHSIEARRRGASMIRDALAAFLENEARVKQRRDGTMGTTAESVGDRRADTDRAIHRGRSHCAEVILSTGAQGEWDAVGDVILQACDLSAMDRALRAALAQPAPAEAFDRLRSLSTARREFTAYGIDGRTLGAAGSDFLRLLGFETLSSG